MYSRNFRPAENRKEGNVPVQLFGDSFSADAFIKNSNDGNKKQESQDSGNEKNINSINTGTADKESSEQSIQTTAVGETSVGLHQEKRLNFDDLLLLGLIFLFLTNTEKKDDIVLPVILAAILMFQ